MRKASKGHGIRRITDNKSYFVFLYVLEPRSKKCVPKQRKRYRLSRFLSNASISKFRQLVILDWNLFGCVTIAISILQNYHTSLLFRQMYTQELQFFFRQYMNVLHGGNDNIRIRERWKLFLNFLFQLLYLYFTGHNILTLMLS